VRDPRLPLASLATEQYVLSPLLVIQPELDSHVAERIGDDAFVDNPAQVLFDIQTVARGA